MKMHVLSGTGVLCLAGLLWGCGGDRQNGSGSDSASGEGTLSGSSGVSGDEGGTDSADSGSGDADGSDGDGGGGPTKFDLGPIPEPNDPGCGDENGGGGGVELSYIWISNSSQGTISKIDTVTMIEEGRYVAKGNGYDDPSRTSVNLLGDVAVASRNGGVTKFWANVQDCQDTNGQPGIQTSSGPNDILPWGTDECMAWHLPLQCSSNRPVAWTRGAWDENTCSYVDAKLWTVCDASVHLIDGDTGQIEQTVVIDGSPFVYGGAADADGNFWGLDTSGSRIFRVEIQDFSWQSWPLPPTGGYGITVDPEGRPWVCGGGGVSRFNLDTVDWNSSGMSGIGGCMTDGESTIWHSSYNSGMLLGFDIETLQVVNQIPLPEYVHGVSVDFYGKVWGVSFAGSNAYRADPDTLQVDTYSQLVGAYTYSDMTGFALSTAGGGAPQG